jgi:DNA-directed RNA polymerase I and III subunit RPAC1
VYGAIPRLEFVESLREGLEVHVSSATDEDLQFDLTGVHAAIANALRRIMIAEVESVALETIYLNENTSIIQDEVLCHRLGLVPLRVDPMCLEHKAADDGPTVRNTLVFSLQVDIPPSERDEPVDVYSSELKWEPLGSQGAVFAGREPRVVHDDILLLKLKPGTKVQLEAHAVRGKGRVHAKWSPSATATYRTLPEVEFVEEVEGEEAAKLVELCPMGVFDIEDYGRGKQRAVAARPRDCTVCRQCVITEPFASKLRLNKVNDHFLFTVEADGSIPAPAIVKRSVGILKAKAVRAREALAEALAAR